VSWFTDAAAGVSHNRFENAARFQQRPQAPPDIYTKRFIGNKEGGINLVEAMENALRGFEEHSVVGARS